MINQKNSLNEMAESQMQSFKGSGIKAGEETEKGELYIKIFNKIGLHAPYETKLYKRDVILNEYIFYYYDSEVPSLEFTIEMLSWDFGIQSTKDSCYY